MITAFLITTLVIFSLNLLLNLIVLGISIGKDSIPYIVLINIVVNLVMVTFNIFALTSQ